MMGSGVRVPPSASGQGPARADLFRFRPGVVGVNSGTDGVLEPGPLGSSPVPSWLRIGCGNIAARAREGAMTQLPLPFPEGGDEYLTVAEAALRLRCCERTIRRAIECGELRAGRVRGGRGSRGA